MIKGPASMNDDQGARMGADVWVRMTVQAGRIKCKQVQMRAEMRGQCE